MEHEKRGRQSGSWDSLGTGIQSRVGDTTRNALSLSAATPATTMPRLARARSVPVDGCSSFARTTFAIDLSSVFHPRVGRGTVAMLFHEWCSVNVFVYKNCIQCLVNLLFDVSKMEDSDF